MRVVRSSTALVLALAQPILDRPAPAQEPAASAAEADVAPGGWQGWASLTNDWPGLSCRYETAPETTTVHLALTGEAGRLAGSVAIDIPAAAGSGCPPLRKRYTIAEVSEEQGAVSFTDSGGNEWALTLRSQGSVLQGLMGWRPGGSDEPLAEDFTSNGVRPLARLAGEVRLQRGDAAAPGTALATTAGPRGTPPKKAGKGTHLKHLGVVVGANVVALGLLYGANQLGKGGAESGTLTCSPRFCLYTVRYQCACNSDQPIVSGASCGETTAGVAQGLTCTRTRPCQSGLSCNVQGEGQEGTCEDNISGACPW